MPCPRNVSNLLLQRPTGILIGRAPSDGCTVLLIAGFYHLTAQMDRGFWAETDVDSNGHVLNTCMGFVCWRFGKAMKYIVFLKCYCHKLYLSRKKISV